MCGCIVSLGLELNQNDFKNALNHLSRRGPDSEGIWSENKIFLGSRRLAIFDLNDRSNQPMQSLCSRYILVFNGDNTQSNANSLASIIFCLPIEVVQAANFLNDKP